MTDESIPSPPLVPDFVGSMPSGLLALASGGALLAGVAFAVAPLIGVGFVLGVAYACLIIERPLIGVYTCIALVPLTAGIRRGFVVPGAKLDEALILGTFVVITLFSGLRREWGIVDITLGLFAVAAFVLPLGSALAHGSSLASLEKMAAPALFVMLFRLVRVANFDDRQRWFAIKLLFWGTVPVVMVALAQRFDVGGTRERVQTLTEGEVFAAWSYQFGSAADRATGVFENWHSLAGYLFPLFLLAIALLSHRDAAPPVRRLAAATAAITLVGIVAAQTITTLVVAMIGAVMVGAMQGRFARTVSILAVTMMLAVVLSRGALSARISTQFEGSGVGQNIESRFQIWTQQYAGPLRSYWPTGYGPTIPSDVVWVHTESLYVTLFLRGGILLVGLYFVLMFVVAATAWRHRRLGTTVDQSLAAAVFAAVLVSIAIHLVFPYLTSSGFPQVLWLLVGLLPTSAAIDRRRPSPGRRGRTISATTARVSPVVAEADRPRPATTPLEAPAR